LDCGEVDTPDKPVWVRRPAIHQRRLCIKETQTDGKPYTIRKIFGAAHEARLRAE
jgi:hypothetical protein